MKRTTDEIYLISDDGDLRRVPRHHYETEDLLQSLIEDHPELLAGDQIGDEDGVRLMLVKREAGIPDGESRSNRWSVDHLLLDQHAIPTLVEVKRSSDTRIRREVVGQVLEYAANVDVYWPSDRIRSLAVEQHGGTNELDRAILDLLDLPEEDDGSTRVEDFWAQVEENLRNGRLRLLFVADELPREVRRIIEFLNEKMTDIEVLGVELRQYVGDGLRAMVPRVIGQTEATRRAKSRGSSPSRPTTRDEFLAVCSDPVRSFVGSLIDDAEARGLVVGWGTKGFSLRVRAPKGNLHSLFYCYPPGAVGRPNAFLEAYLGESLRGTETGTRLKASIAAVPGFTPSGRYTSRLVLTTETLGAAQQAVEFVWQAAEEITRGSVDRKAW